MGVPGNSGPVISAAMPMSSVGVAVETQNLLIPDVDAYGGAYGLAFLDQFLMATEDSSLSTPADGRDALQIARVIEAAYASSDRGEHVVVAS